MVLVIALVLGVRAIFFRPLARFTSVGTNPTDQAWLGFGINEYPQDRNRSGAAIPWTNSAWALTTQRLAFLRPGLTRINVYLGWFNPSGNLTSFDWNTWQMRNLDQVLSWYRASGLRVQIGMWHDVVDGPPDNPDVYTSKAWADVQAALLYRLVKVDGYGNIYGYAGLNEWDCQYMHPPAGFTWSQWQTATSNLRSAFTAAGLHTALIGPDTGCSGPSAPLRAAEDEPGALAAYEDHDYPTERQIISGEVESQYAPVVSRVDRADARRKPLYVAEMGVSDPDYTPDPPIGSYAYGLDMFDYAVQALRSGAAGALAWCLDGFDDNKNCGMWNISGNDGGTALRPWFYAWSLLCRFFPPGATIYAMREPAQVRIAAARIPIGNGSSSWTFALVNRLSTPQVVTLAMPGWRGGTFDEFVYSSSNRTVNASGFPVPRQQIVATHGKPLTGLTVTVSPNSAVLLTTASALPAA
ncbi:MAG: hypothetical protein ACRDOK_16865 [Streptosporangiaceae bacterium]